MDAVIAADPEYCNPYDAALAAHGPACVFLRDPEGRFRFDAEWTRDAWGRAADRAAALGVSAELPAHSPVWALARDNDSGYVQIVLATSPDLLHHHPRLAFRVYPSFHDAEQALVALGRPPLAVEPW